jgi:anti-sigma B factor antagonist
LFASDFDAFPRLLFWTDQHVDVTVVHIAGEVDMATEPDLSKAVMDALAGGSSLIVADLAAVTFFGVTGLKVLFHAHTIAQSRRRRFRVVLGAGAARRAVQVTGFEQILAVHDTLEDALKRRHRRTGRDV